MSPSTGTIIHPTAIVSSQTEPPVPEVRSHPVQRAKAYPFDVDAVRTTGVPDERSATQVPPAAAQTIPPVPETEPPALTLTDRR